MSGGCDTDAAACWTEVKNRFFNFEKIDREVMYGRAHDFLDSPSRLQTEYRTGFQRPAPGITRSCRLITVGLVAIELVYYNNIIITVYAIYLIIATRSI